QTVISPRGNVSGADPVQFATTYHYDFNGNLTSRSHPFPGGGTVTTQTGFDSLNQTISITDPLGKTTTTGYDQAGNRISQVDPLRNAQSWRYDGNNQVVEARPAATLPPTVSHYDAAGRLDSQTTPLGEKTTFAYDAAGHQVAMTSPRGNVPGADPAQFTI